MESQSVAAPERYAKVAEHSGCGTRGGSARMAKSGVAKVRELIKVQVFLPIYVRWRHVKKFPQMAKDALKISTAIENNPRPIEESDAIQILKLPSKLPIRASYEGR